MGILSLFQRKQKNTQVVLKSNTSLERAADSILSQRGKQIVDGLNKPTASTGTPTFALCRADGSPSQNNPTPEEKADSGAM